MSRGALQTCAALVAAFGTFTVSLPAHAWILWQCQEYPAPGENDRAVYEDALRGKAQEVLDRAQAVLRGYQGIYGQDVHDATWVTYQAAQTDLWALSETIRERKEFCETAERRALEGEELSWELWAPGSGLMFRVDEQIRYPGAPVDVEEVLAQIRALEGPTTGIELVCSGCEEPDRDRPKLHHYLYEDAIRAFFASPSRQTLAAARLDAIEDAFLLDTRTVEGLCAAAKEENQILDVEVAGSRLADTLASKALQRETFWSAMKGAVDQAQRNLDDTERKVQHEWTVADLLTFPEVRAETLMAHPELAAIDCHVANDIGWEDVAGAVLHGAIVVSFFTLGPGGSMLVYAAINAAVILWDVYQAVKAHQRYAEVKPASELGSPGLLDQDVVRGHFASFKVALAMGLADLIFTVPMIRAGLRYAQAGKFQRVGRAAKVDRPVLQAMNEEKGAVATFNTVAGRSDEGAEVIARETAERAVEKTPAVIFREVRFPPAGDNYTVKNWQDYFEAFDIDPSDVRALDRMIDALKKEKVNVNLSYGGDSVAFGRLTRTKETLDSWGAETNERVLRVVVTDRDIRFVDSGIQNASLPGFVRDNPSMFQGTAIAVDRPVRATANVTFVRGQDGDWFIYNIADDLDFNHAVFTKVKELNPAVAEGDEYLRRAKTTYDYLVEDGWPVAMNAIPRR